MKNGDLFQYSIFDPAGNITALVESDVCIEDQPKAAEMIMAAHPEVEQVGFVHFSDDPDELFQGELRMAGGEFCGNASSCTAVFYVLKRSALKKGESVSVKLRVSGTLHPVIVQVTPAGRDLYNTCIQMPPAVSISDILPSFDKLSENLTVVELEGISHIIITPDSGFFQLLHKRHDAEKAVRKWCGELNASGLGLMFLEKTKDACKLNPLVYIPGSGTVFWENSCASGSAAVGLYLSRKNDCPVSITLSEPGGDLRVESNYPTSETLLYGQIRYINKGK